MADKYVHGKITYIHHEKGRAVIEYTDRGKTKTIHGDVTDKVQEKLLAQKLIRKPHRFMTGDQVKFVIKSAGENGKISYADNIQYQYNTALEVLINKSSTENKFLGYIKTTGNEHFIKEINSYLFFPLRLSAFEKPPVEKEGEKAVPFKLENTDKPDKITAVLYNRQYIPEFLKLVQYSKKKETINAVVTRITPFALHLRVLTDRITTRLPINDQLKDKIDRGVIGEKSLLPVKIKHIGDERIIVEEA